MATKSKHIAALEAQLASPDECIRHAAALELSRLERARQARLDKRRPAEIALRKALEAATAALKAEKEARQNLESRLLLAEIEDPEDPAPPAPAPPAQLDD